MADVVFGTVEKGGGATAAILVPRAEDRTAAVFITRRLECEMWSVVSRVTNCHLCRQVESWYSVACGVFCLAELKLCTKLQIVRTGRRGKTYHITCCMVLAACIYHFMR